MSQKATPRNATKSHVMKGCNFSVQLGSKTSPKSSCAWRTDSCLSHVLLPFLGHQVAASLFLGGQPRADSRTSNGQTLNQKSPTKTSPTNQRNHKRYQQVRYEGLISSPQAQPPNFRCPKTPAQLPSGVGSRAPAPSPASARRCWSPGCPLGLGGMAWKISTHKTCTVLYT